MRRTHALVSTMAALMADPYGTHWGYKLSKSAGVRSGVLYPILRHMLNEGWLTDGWETRSKAEGRPPRRYYQVTAAGAAAMASVLADATC